MSDHIEEELSVYELVMPFVTVASVGGPHDDDSYAAGWAMGALDVRLKAARDIGLGLPEVTVLRANLPQVDLIAMSAGARMVERFWPEGTEPDEATRAEWAFVSFDWTTS